MDNAHLGVTPETYLEICSFTGNEPKEEEVPVEFGDLFEETQLLFEIYELLDTNYSFGGDFLGKSFSNLEFLFKVYHLDKDLYKVYLLWLKTIDRKNIDIYMSKKPTPAPNIK